MTTTYHTNSRGDDQDDEHSQRHHSKVQGLVTLVAIGEFYTEDLAPRVIGASSVNDTTPFNAKRSKSYKEFTNINL